MPENTINITAGDNASFEGVAIGDRNKIISHVQAQGHVVQADHSQVHIGDIYYYFEIPKSDVIKREPYKFLSTYGLADEDIFFGRKQAIADLSSQILDHKLVIINGKSGSGKSSLMHAGVTPKLLRNNQLVIHITDYLTTPVPTIQEAIQGGLESSIVIFLDQFERFFIYLPAPEQQRFTAAFREWLTDEKANVRFVIAIRMDFFGRLGEFQPVIPNLYQESAIFTLLPLNRDEAREAIEGPLEALKIRIVYEPELLDTLLDSLLEESEIEPAQLQIVCDELYRRALASNAKIINAALYETAGGVKGMLENYLQRKLAEYTPDDDEVKAILKQMIAPVEISAGIRTFVAVTQITERLKLPQPDIERLITRLVDDRLIEQKQGEDTYSIAHEYLAGQVQQWFDPRETAIRRARDILDHAVRYETLMPYEEASQVKEYAADLDMNDTERTVLQRSLRKHTMGVWLRWGIVAVITLFAVISVIVGLYINVQRNEAVQESRRAIIRSLVAYALQDNSQKERERAALLARHAFLLNLNQHYQGNAQGQIDAALSTIFHTAAITEEPYSTDLQKQVCEKVNLKITLTPDELTQFVGSALPYELACPELSQIYPLHLRSMRMITDDFMALWLNMAAQGLNVQYGILAHDVQNKFEDRGEVIVDHATGLMWENSVLPEPKRYSTYADVRDYITQLNRQKFAGYDNWRLPTIPELMSLLELQRDGDLLIDHRFDRIRKYCWSADVRIKDETSTTSSWFVYFDDGIVHWGSRGDGYVRCVRPEQ